MPDSPAPQRLKNHRAADAEADNRAKGGNVKNPISDVLIIGDQRDGSKGNSKHVQPQRRQHIRQVASKSHLQKQRSKTDSGYNHQRKRTEKSATASEDNDEREGKDEKAGSNDCPSTSNLARAGIGQWALSALCRIPLL